MSATSTSLPSLASAAALPDQPPLLAQTPPSQPPLLKRDERLRAMRYWLLDGLTSAQVEAAAEHTWKVSPRTARRYLRDVKRRCAAESSEEDYLAQLWLAKLQRDHLADNALSKLKECKEDKTWMALLRVCQQLLRERDQLLTRIRDHRVRTQRDTSPDGEAARLQRQGRIALTEQELEERIMHCGNYLFQQWLTKQPPEGATPSAQGDGGP